MKNLTIALLFSFVFFKSVHVYSQGCSDAGVCTIGSLSLVQFKYELLPFEESKLPLLVVEDPKIDTSNSGKTLTDSTLKELKYVTQSTSINDTSKNKKIEFVQYAYQYPKFFFQLSTSFGIGDRATNISITQFEGNIRMINKILFAQVKVPYYYISGKLGEVNGLGDITIGATFIAFSKTKSNLSFSGGVKIPTNDANLAKDSLPLPMVYQTSLGTTDVLLGAKYTFKKWDFTFGYQHSFNSNKNEYQYRPTSKDSSIYNSYFESNMLSRSDDAIFRINRTFIRKKLNASAGLLFIYHIKNDSYINKTGERQTINGSDGLTLNLNFALAAPLSKKMDLILIYASPVVTRKVRPDGLTRKLIIQIGLKYNIF